MYIANYKLYSHKNEVWIMCEKSKNPVIARNPLAFEEF